MICRRFRDWYHRWQWERKTISPRAGSNQLHLELAHLQETLRPALVAATQGDGSVREELQLLDQRIAYLEQSLRTAEIVPPPENADDRVRFGATVTVRDGNGEENRYRIVGVDETAPDQNWVSWQSPIARALLNASIGQRVPFKFPSGQTELEIVGITYE